MRHLLIRLGSAVTAYAVLFAWRPLAPDDPLGVVLWTLPAAVGALAILERQVIGGRSGGRGVVTELVAVVLLLLLTLGRRSLGLAVTDVFLAAGFGLLLLHRVARLLPGLCRLLGPRLPARPSWAFFFLPLVVYLAVAPWACHHRQPDGDEPYYLLIAHSLAYDFDADLTNNYQQEDGRFFIDRPLEPQPGDPVGPQGELYSRHTLLLPLILAPLYRLAGYAGAVFGMAVLTALLAWMFLRLAHFYAPERPRAVLVAWTLFALGPPLLFYSYQMWVEVPAALLLTLGLEQILRRQRAGRWTPRGIVTLALVLALLPLLKLRLILVAGPLLVLAWWRSRSDKRAAIILLASLLAVLAVLLAHNQLRFGNPLKIYSPQELDVLNGSWGKAVGHLSGMFFDVAFGLFPSAPLWFLIVPGAILLLRQRHRLVVDFAFLAVPYFLALAPRLEWYGGWAPPFRYPLVFLPLFGLLLIPALALKDARFLRVLITALGAATVVLAVIFVVMPGWTYNFADGSNHLLDHASVRLQADVARLFPSAVRPRSAGWIWPLVSLLALPLLLRRGGRRPAPQWGVVLLLAAMAAVPLAVAKAPTRIIELEDAWIKKERGKPYPDLWVPQRPAYRGGWVIRSRARLEAPLVPGGDTLSLRIALRLIEHQPRQPFVLRVAAGEEVLASVRIERGRLWQEVELGPFDWPQDQPLVLLGPEQPPPRWHTNAVVLDRVELTWR